MELYWDMEHHIAEFRLNVMEEETPVQLWRTSVPVPTSDAAIDLLKPLKALGDLCLLTLQNHSRHNGGYSRSCICTL